MKNSPKLNLIIPMSLFQDNYNVILDLGDIEKDEKSHYKIHLIDVGKDEEELAVDIRLFDPAEEYCGPGVQLTLDQLDKLIYLTADILPDCPLEYSSMEEIEGEG